MSSNVSQSYPYSSETEDERAAAVDAAYAANQGLQDRVKSEASPLGMTEGDEAGNDVKWWTWVCPDCIEGRLHIAGYVLDRHGLYTVCDKCGSTHAR